MLTMEPRHYPAARGAVQSTVLLALCLLAAPDTAAENAPAVHGYRVVNVYPHDTGAFTQGLLLDRGMLLESIGGYGRSAIRRVELHSGRVVSERRLPPRYFGEGLSRAGDLLVQLTWREQRAFLYDPETFELRGSAEYPGEGWGLAFDGEHLVMSDGSASLRFLDLPGLTEVRRIEVRDRGTPVPRLNELEYIEGKIYANVWFEERIAVISPRNGEVETWIDLSGLLPLAFRRDPEEVLNGIAYDARTGHLLVTGKGWPRLFEIEVLPAPRGGAR